jgi:SAM-dependent methyltransferase
MTIEAVGPNAQQISYWNEQPASKWVELESKLDAQIAQLGLATMDRAGVQAGDRVLDVGCGCGQTVLQLAERVGTQGSVTGIDVSSVMLSRAGARAEAGGYTQVRLENADAQTAALPAAGFDLVFSRFGVMFFADPTAAFANLRAALDPRGRLAFVCWQGIDRNPWMRVPLVAAAQHVPLPAPPPPGAPGPFAFADAERVQSILEGAGFRNVELESVEREVLVGGEGPLEQAVEFVLQMGPTGAALRQAEAEIDRPALLASVREALAPYAGPRGVRMPSASWIASARA